MVGGIPPARIEQTKQKITLAEKDLKMLAEKNSKRLKQLITDEKGLLLQIRMQKKSLIKIQETLNMEGIFRIHKLALNGI